MHPAALPMPLLGRAIAAILITVTAGVPTVSAQAAREQYYQAYHLEHAQGDVAAAAKLYARAIASGELPADLQATAEQRLAACREELATADYARLMPPRALAYVEVNNPGERVRALLGQLGMLADPNEPQPPTENRLAISPAIIDSLLGIRGVAAAITGFNMETEEPTGVAVLHPGDVELVRGLIATALLAQSEIIEPIGGHPTYRAEEFYVTLTQRLVIVSTDREGIVGVVARLQGKTEESLATDPAMAEVLAERDGALVYFCVNPKPLLPMLTGLAAHEAQDRELAVAQALLDLESLQSLVGRLDIGEDGLLLELSLRLDEGHRNLVYNFLRRPAVDAATLRCIPSGAAGFIALAMNDPSTSYRNPALSRDEDRPVVTALDIGRELFANVNGIAVYALPPEKAGRGGTGEIPDVAVAITVKDVAQSQALWNEILGIASLAAGAPTMEGEARRISGVPVRSYRFEDQVTIHVATLDDGLLIASTDGALKRSIQARRSGTSVLDDGVFARPLDRLGPNTTLAMLAHPGRCIQLALPMMSPDEVAEAAPIAALVQDTTACVTVDHSDRMLRLSATVSGIPDVSGFVNKMLQEERRQTQTQQGVARALRDQDWDRAVRLLDEQLAENPHSASVLRKKFDILALHKGDHSAAAALSDDLFAALRDNARALNNFAWALLTKGQYEHAYNEMALRFARRSNELTEHKRWAYLDTLALAEFEAGNAAEAIRLEEQAIELCRGAGGHGLEKLTEALERFRGATAGEL